MNNSIFKLEQVEKIQLLDEIKDHLERDEYDFQVTFKGVRITVDVPSMPTVDSAIVTETQEMDKPRTDTLANGQTIRIKNIVWSSDAKNRNELPTEVPYYILKETWYERNVEIEDEIMSFLYEKFKAYADSIDWEYIYDNKTLWADFPTPDEKTLVQLDDPTGLKAVYNNKEVVYTLPDTTLESERIEVERQEGQDGIEYDSDIKQLNDLIKELIKEKNIVSATGQVSGNEVKKWLGSMATIGSIL